MSAMSEVDRKESLGTSGSEGDGDNSAKVLLLFVTGILLVGFVVYLLVQNNKPVDLETAPTNENLTKTLEEIQTPAETPKPDEVSLDQSFSQQNSGSKEVQGMTTNSLPKEQNLPSPQPVQQNQTTGQEVSQKLTVEQKLKVLAPEQTLDPEKSYAATLKTSMGDIVLELDAKNRPKTVNSFVFLAKMGFYDDVIFHRVIAGFMIQGGDPLGMGTGGPAYKFEDELFAPNANVKGTIAMANSGPNTNSSQFFINLVDNTYLDSKHTVFGKVTSGMEVVEAIGKVKTDSRDRPLEPVTIKSVELTQN